MSGFKWFAESSLSPDKVSKAVQDSLTLSEVLSSLKIENSPNNRRRLSYWCKIQKIGIKHLSATKVSQPKKIARLSEDFLKDLICNSSNLSQLCMALGFPPQGNAYRALGVRVKELYPSSKPPFKKEVSSYENKVTMFEPDTSFFVKGILRSGGNLKRRLLLTGVLDKCSVCGLLPEWNGKTLVLQVDHVDGDPTNNTLENLRIICPNCHTQQETTSSRKMYKGRTSLKTEKVIKRYKAPVLVCSLCGGPKKKKSKTNLCSDCSRKSLRKVSRPSKEALVKLLSGETSFLALGKSLGVSDQAVRKWCKQYGLDTKALGRAAMTLKNKQASVAQRQEAHR